MWKNLEIVPETCLSPGLSSLFYELCLLLTDNMISLNQPEVTDQGRYSDGFVSVIFLQLFSERAQLMEQA